MNDAPRISIQGQGQGDVPVSFRASRFGERFGTKVDAALLPEVCNEQLNMVLGHTRLGTLVATAFAVFLALQLRGTALPAWIVDGWLVAKLGVAAARICISVHYDRLGRPGGPGWSRTTDGWLLADGIVWGAAGYTLMSSPVELAALACVVMGCVSCVATFGLQFSKRSTAAYVAPILTLTALGLLTRGDQIGSIAGTGLLMLLGLLLATAVASEKRLVDMLTLRLRAQALSLEKDEALKLALRQSAVKTQFISNVSHELRTPLHGILGVTRLLRLDASDSVVTRRLELIESSGTHLLGLINDLLDISRIEAGQFAMRRERFELGAVVQNLADLYTVRAVEKGLEFTLNLQLDEPCWVTGDPARVRQVLHNLLGNAVKFTQRGTITLTLMRDTETGRLSAEVQDTGPGIEAEDLAHVFEAFRQVGGAASRPFEGTGLGLTIARDIAQAMGGDISMRSQVGVGTCALFTAMLPAAAPTEPAAVPETFDHLLADGPSTCRVLIAEDDDVNAVIATAYLEHMGINAERVKDGRLAVHQALRETDRPDLVLMDCRMPTMDGMMATREIRKQEECLGLPRVPVVALTATTSDINRQLCLNAGMDDFMSKPYTREDLQRVLQRWTRRKVAVTS
ncbi:MAG: response regulator [Rubrivivax sp.]|nr:response regulator [Rubrivivax sp.]